MQERLSDSRHHENEAGDDKFLPFTLNGISYKWQNQYITGVELKKLGNIPADHILILLIDKPWEDEIIENDTKVNLARKEVEHFKSIKHHHELLVKISINDKPYQVNRGKHRVAEIKKLADIPSTDELDELIEGKLIPLKNDGFVIIKGCEQFFSHKPDGSSS